MVARVSRTYAKCVKVVTAVIIEINQTQGPSGRQGLCALRV